MRITTRARARVSRSSVAGTVLALVSLLLPLSCDRAAPGENELLRAARDHERATRRVLHVRQLRLQVEADRATFEQRFECEAEFTVFHPAPGGETATVELGCSETDIRYAWIYELSDGAWCRTREIRQRMDG